MDVGGDLPDGVFDALENGIRHLDAPHALLQLGHQASVVRRHHQLPLSVFPACGKEERLVYRRRVDGEGSTEDDPGLTAKEAFETDAIRPSDDPSALRGRERMKMK